MGALVFFKLKAAPAQTGSCAEKLACTLPIVIRCGLTKVSVQPVLFDAIKVTV